MSNFIGITAGKRTKDGGFENHIRCNFCTTKEITVIAADYDSLNAPVFICKTCANEAINAIDERYQKSFKED